MKSKIISRVVFIALIGGFFIFQCFRLVPNSLANEVVVIVNKSVKETSLSKAELRNIFLGKTIEWQDNQTIFLATLKEGPTNELFLEKYVGKTPSQYRTYFKRLLYSGRGDLPKIFKDQESLIQYVANTKGAIGYVSSDIETEFVKIIKIN